MNPTDEVDDLLARAGARWRADQPSAPEPDLERMLGGRRRPRAWVPALAAASVAAIAAAALTVLPGGDKEPVAGPAGTNSTSKAFAQGNQAPNDDLLVRDGDRVEVGGQVIAAPGKEPVFCPPLPRPAIGWAKGQEPAPSCEPQYAVTLKGLDLSRLADAKTIKGVRTGQTQVTGIWAGQAIEVQDQRVPQTRSTTAELQVPPDQVPCPEPAGGWKAGYLDIDKVAVSKFLDSRQDQANDPRVLYPKGHTPGAPEVYTIGVAHGDLAAFRTAFEKVYDGNLCVHQVKLSNADLAKIGTSIGDVINKGLGVYGYGAADVDKFGIMALVYDEALKTALTPGGLENFDLEVAVKPVK
ncbi:hypothetical protein ACGFIF_26365 [Kribbella sp. NPDC049174]|uniref:hypothetical protein n=1 Tax=Kribbella sp. NPDC049174 TaxID=3364112 RepID=UPI00371A4CEA